MQQATEQVTEFLQIPWALQMSALADAIRARGRYVPAGYTVALDPVPEDERDANGLPMFRAVLVPVNGVCQSRVENNATPSNSNEPSSTSSSFPPSAHRW